MCQLWKLVENQPGVVSLYCTDELGHPTRIKQLRGVFGTDQEKGP